MEHYTNYDLWSSSTMRTHSIAKDYYIPADEEELKTLVHTLFVEGRKYFLLSGGSNVVFDDYVETAIINLTKVNNTIQTIDGVTEVGCSLRIQQLIQHLKENHLGGIEYLYSLPARVGGCIYMNAGRGKKLNQSISDFIESVQVYSPSENVTKQIVVTKSDFEYRKSSFQKKDYIILSAFFRFPEQDPVVTEEKIKERLDYSNKNLSADKPSCGSVFLTGNRILFRLMKGMSIGDACFSKKTSNWITNRGNAKGSDVIRLIKRGLLIHKLTFQSCETEIRIVD